MQATLFLYRMVDICDELDVRKFEDKLKELKARPLKLRHFTPAYLNFSNPPVEMDGESWRLMDDELTVRTQFKFYSLGSVTIRYEIKFEADNCPALFNHAQAIINNSVWPGATERFAQTARSLVERELQIKTRFGDLEDYNILWLQDKFEPRDKELKILSAQFLRNEFMPLSEGEREEAWHYRFSYTMGDVTVLDWDRAVTVSPEAEDDIWDVLEYANLQLLELRYYDGVLDRRLQEIYAVARRPRWNFLDFWRTPRLLKRTLRVFLDFSFMEERINSFLRLTGDEFLSRVYLASAKRLNIKNTQDQLRERVGDARELYQTLAEQMNAWRAEFLEVVVIVLIAVEIVLFFWEK